MSVIKFTTTVAEIERQVVADAMKATYTAVKAELAPALGEVEATAVAARVALSVVRNLTTVTPCK